MTTKLEARVKAVNAAHKAANDLYPQLREVFEPLIGQNVTKNDGTLLARIIKLLPDLPDTHNLTVFGKNSRHNYSISFTIKTCQNYDDDHCTDYEIGLYIADLKNGVITRIYDKEERRTNFTTEEVTKDRETYKQAKKLADAAYSKLTPFGD